MQSTIDRMRGDFSRAVLRTAGVNMAMTGAAGAAGILLARYLGPEDRGHYAALMAWFGLALVIGELGQSASVCYHVSRHTEHRRTVVATSRMLMVASSVIVVAATLSLSGVLAQGVASVRTAYLISSVAIALTLLATSYMFALQALDIRSWNVTRALQPLLWLVCVVVTGLLGLLTLHVAVVILAVTLAIQLLFALLRAGRFKVRPGSPTRQWAKPLLSYGARHLASLLPSTLNRQLDQLVLAWLVAPEELGAYAVAVSLTVLAVPLAAAVGNVAFPRAASAPLATEARRGFEVRAILASVAAALGVVVPLAASASWLVPTVFGQGFAPAIPLVWLLCPGALFLCVARVVGDLLRANGRPGAVAFSEWSGLAATVPLLVVLLPRLGATGAAVTSTIAYCVTAGVLLGLLQRRPDADNRADSENHVH